MEFIEHLPIWLLALMIFCLRIVDVSLGTIRTISVVQGRMNLASILGFVEVFIWLLAVAQVITRVNESILLLFAYAGGFAAGNAFGIIIERKLALGAIVLQIISHGDGDRIAKTLRESGQGLTTFIGQGRDGPVTMLYAICPRKSVRKLLTTATSIDPNLFFVVEPVSGWKGRLRPILNPTGWRHMGKRK